jgi:tRNA(adenine34) deaminase
VEEEKDLKFMRLALLEAKTAAQAAEVPVGAVITVDDTVLARAHNERLALKDPTAHAEIVAMRAAALRVGRYILDDATLYVTLEPCVMCVGAALNARIKRIVYGCADPKAGAIGSVYDIGRDGRLNHAIEVRSGVMPDECAAELQEFFRARRRDI